MDRQTARKMVSDATDLDELLAALQEIEAQLAGGPDEDDPLCVRVAELVDVTSLPTYGGQEPRDTTGVWSWDATRLLVGEGSWAECWVEDRLDEETLRALRIEAVAAGDTAQVELCSRALAGDEVALIECIRVVAEGQG